MKSLRCWLGIHRWRPIRSVWGPCGARCERCDREDWLRIVDDPVRRRFRRAQLRWMRAIAVMGELTPEQARRTKRFFSGDGA